MVIRFSEITEKMNIGNKARTLGILKNNGFNVPDGIVIDCDEYQKLLAENGINENINSLLGKLNKNNIEEVSSKLMDIILSVGIGNELKSLIDEKTSDNVLYAVRSSGQKEDLQDYSFAGQYETFLNIEKQDICSKIIECYSSMYSQAVLGYMINNDIEITDIGMNIIIQEMVPSEYSGVCFTVNPVTGNDKQMLIEAARGLGENVVDGKVVPEQYLYDWYEGCFSYDENNKFLNKSVLEKMCSEFLKLQLFFGYPCDIEFGLYNNELYILQARKITKIKYGQLKYIWTTADFRDGGVSATVCKPYMWSLYEYVWNYSISKFLIESSLCTEDEVPSKMGGMFYGRGYWNLSVIKTGMSKIIGYNEREFDSEYGMTLNYEGDGKTTRISPKSCIDVAKIASAHKKIVDKRLKSVDDYKTNLLKRYHYYKKNHDENNIEDIEATWYKLTKKHYLQSETIYFWQIFINTVEQAFMKHNILKYISEGEYLALMGGIDNISHLRPFYDLWNISRKIRNDKDKLEYWTNKTVKEIIADIDGDSENAGLAEKTLLDRHISEYGHHSDKELDVSYCCHFEDKTSVIASLKEMTGLEDDYSPLEDRKQGRKQCARALNKIRDKVGRLRFAGMRKSIARMKKMLWWREELRDISTKFYYIIRVYTIRYAESLVSRGLLDDIDDIWFLKIEDIWNYIEKRYTADDLKKICVKNKTYYNSYLNYISDNEIGQELEINGLSGSRNNKVFKGAGANSGKVTGVARVIESFDEIGRIQKGDILVTKYTDTGWTTKFAQLSGIVTEYGGILCHVAVVSREYGIPAVVNCPNVIRKIKDGQIITVDGDTGTVTIES